MKIYKLETEISINTTIDKAWEFFSSPDNLQKITPEYMGFDILDKFDKMYPGQIIRYLVSPLFGLKLRWVTEITHFIEPNYFVDEQRFGPYKFWHHKHFFVENQNGGIDIKDIVHYGLPFGIIGRVINYFFVTKKLEEIFNYRTQRIIDIFK